MRTLPAIDPDLSRHYDRKGEKLIYEAAHAFVIQRGEGHYVVFRVCVTHSERCGTYHFPRLPEYALERAIEHAERVHFFANRPYGR